MARPLGWGMGCILWAKPLIDILPQFLQLFMHYYTILDRVLTALDCIWPSGYACWIQYIIILVTFWFSFKKAEEATSHYSKQWWCSPQWGPGANFGYNPLALACSSTNLMAWPPIADYFISLGQPHLNFVDNIPSRKGSKLLSQPMINFIYWRIHIITNICLIYQALTCWSTDDF